MDICRLFYWNNKMVENRFNFWIFRKCAYCLNFCKLFTWQKFLKISLEVLYDILKLFITFREVWRCSFWVTKVSLTLPYLIYAQFWMFCWFLWIIELDKNSKNLIVSPYDIFSFDVNFSELLTCTLWTMDFWVKLSYFNA